MQFNFQYGKKETSMSTWVKLTLAIKMGVPFLARLLHVKETNLYALLDEIVRKYFPQSVVNEFFIKDSELLSLRVDRDLSKAEEDYKLQTDAPTIVAPEYTSKVSDGSRAQDLLGGEMSLGNNFTEE